MDAQAPSCIWRPENLEYGVATQMQTPESVGQRTELSAQVILQELPENFPRGWVEGI